MVYAVSTRRIVTRQGKQVFEPTMGEATYLAAPDDAKTFDPSQAVKATSSKSAGERWALQILADLPRDNLGRPAGDLIFYVHGFNVDAQSAFDSHQEISRNITEAGFPHLFVSFDWPSNGSLLDYLQDGLNADKASPLLVESGIAMFAQFTTPDCQTRVHVLCHSMGAKVVRQGVDFAAGHPPTSQRAWGITQLILVAADISAGSLRNERGQPMLDKAQRVTCYSSGYDAALATSNIKRFESSPRAGRKGVPAEMRDVIADVDCSPGWKDYIAQPGHPSDLVASHVWYWNDTDVFIPDLVETLRGDTDRNKIGRRKPDPDNPGRLLLV